MSNQSPKNDDIENDTTKDESKLDKKEKLNKNDEDNEEEDDDGYSCKKCWGGYCACIVAICKVIIILKNIVYVQLHCSC